MGREVIAPNRAAFVSFIPCTVRSGRGSPSALKISNPTGVAEPSLLKDDKTVRQALEFHKEVFNQVSNCKIENLRNSKFCERDWRIH